MHQTSHKKEIFKLLSPALIVLPVLWFYYPKIIVHLSKPKELWQLLSVSSGIASFSIQFLFLNIALFGFVAFIDLLSLGWKGSAVRRLFSLRSASARGDWWCWLLSVVNVYDFFVLFFSMGMFYVITALLNKAGGFHLIALIPGTGLQVLVIFLLSDLKQYVWHRFMHLRHMWPLHAYHHSATEFNLTTAARAHFFEKGILTLFDGLLFALLGAPIIDVLALMLFKEVYNYFLHSDVNWGLGFFGRYLIISPKAHRLHHSKDPRFYAKNFGNFFIFWDKLFGTYQSSEVSIQIGVEDTYYNKHGFWVDMWLGYKHFVLGLFGRK
jgi:sterol desaturase/sphingolipid hydroxylase (fatty acid hydroxylase superfamily)